MDDSTRTRILLGAGEAFAELGYKATTIREIADRADVNLAAVNYHFGDKERLYIETVKYAHQFRVQQAPIPDWPEGTAAETKLRDFVRTIITRMLVVQGLPWQMRLLMREILHPTAACRELAQDSFRPHFELLLSILDELVPAATPLHRRHQLAFSIFGQCLFYRLHEPVIGMLIPQSELEEHFTPPPDRGLHRRHDARRSWTRALVFSERRV